MIIKRYPTEQLLVIAIWMYQMKIARRKQCQLSNLGEFVMPDLQPLLTWLLQSSFSCFLIDLHCCNYSCKVFLIKHTSMFFEEIRSGSIESEEQWFSSLSLQPHGLVSMDYKSFDSVMHNDNAMIFFTPRAIRITMNAGSILWPSHSSSSSLIKQSISIAWMVSFSYCTKFYRSDSSFLYTMLMLLTTNFAFYSSSCLILMDLHQLTSQ